MYCKYASMYGVEYLMDTMQVYHVSASALRVAVQGSGGFSTSGESFAGMFQPGKIMVCELL